MNKTLLFCMLLLATALKALPQAPGSLTDHPAPALTVHDGNGAPVSLSGLKGSVVLVDFWASWCGPCRRNNPHLARLYKKYHQQGFEILGVSLDDNLDAWKTAIAQDKLSWLQSIDEKGGNGPSAAAYGVMEIPASFLLDKNGVIRGVNLEGWGLESGIKSLLKNK